jgi:hypothetical protein
MHLASARVFAPAAAALGRYLPSTISRTERLLLELGGPILSTRFRPICAQGGFSGLTVHFSEADIVAQMFLRCRLQHTR